MDRDQYRAWLQQVSACDSLAALTALREEVARLPLGNERHQKLLNLSDHRWRVLPLAGYRFAA
jgi:hypothetical protein